MPTSGSPFGASVPRRRNGRPQACEPCHKRKVACDHALPVCSRCKRGRISNRCVYVVQNDTPARSPPRTRQANRQRVSRSPTPFTPQSDGTQGFLGATSYTAVLQEAQSSLTPTPGEPSGSIDGHDGAVSRFSLDDRSYDSAMRVLRNVPCEEDCRFLLKWNVNPNEGWCRTATEWLIDTLWTTFGPLLRDGTPKALTQMALTLSRNSSRVLREDYTDPREWFTSFSGPNMRWESLGILFSSWALGAKAAPHSYAGEQVTSEEAQKSLCKYKECSWGCIEITRNMASANTLLQHLVCRQSIVESIVTGDSSESPCRATTRDFADTSRPAALATPWGVTELGHVPRSTRVSGGPPGSLHLYADQEASVCQGHHLRQAHVDLYGSTAPRRSPIRFHAAAARHPRRRPPRADAMERRPGRRERMEHAGENVRHHVATRSSNDCFRARLYPGHCIATHRARKCRAAYVSVFRIHQGQS